MKWDIPVALVGNFGRQRFAVEIVELDIHLHIKIKEHIAELHINVAAQYLESTLIKKWWSFP